MLQLWFDFNYVSYLNPGFQAPGKNQHWTLKKKQSVDEDLESKSQRRWWLWPQWTPPWLTFTRPGRHCHPAPSRATNHRTRILHTNFAPKLHDSGRSQQLGSQLPRRLQPGNKLFLHWQAPNQDTSCLNFEIYHTITIHCIGIVPSWMRFTCTQIVFQLQLSNPWPLTRTLGHSISNQQNPLEGGGTVASVDGHL